MLNVRLNKDMEKYSQQSNQSKSDIVKEALAMYFVRVASTQYPYELRHDLFDYAGSGRLMDLFNTKTSSTRSKVRSLKVSYGRLGQRSPRLCTCCRSIPKYSPIFSFGLTGVH